MELRVQLEKDLAQARQAGDKVRENALRLLLAALTHAEKNADQVLDEQHELRAVAHRIRETEIELDRIRQAADQIGIKDLERALDFYRAYLPTLDDDDTVSQLVDTAVTLLGVTSVADAGRVMAWLMPHIQGRADRLVVERALAERLTGKKPA